MNSQIIGGAIHSVELVGECDSCQDAELQLTAS